MYVEPEPTQGSWLKLDNPRALGFGIDAYGGIGMEFSGGDDRAHMVGGGLARLRLGYFQVGGTFELTDSGENHSLGEAKIEHWRAFGGFAGVMLPYHHWVDVDATLGVEARTYVNSSTIYGANGLSASLPALTLRFGVSDRVTHKLVSPRLGAAMVFTADLEHRDAPWHYRYQSANGTVSESSGTTAIGGVSIVLVLTVGFEVGARAR